MAVTRPKDLFNRPKNEVSEGKDIPGFSSSKYVPVFRTEARIRSLPKRVKGG